MRKEVFNDLVEEYLAKCKAVLSAKDPEYSSDDDRLHNFVVAGHIKGTSPRDALFGMLVKHWVSISDMCLSGKEYPDALWDEKLVDNINYTLLLKGILHDEMMAKVRVNVLPEVIIKVDSKGMIKDIDRVREQLNGIIK